MRHLLLSMHGLLLSLQARCVWANDEYQHKLEAGSSFEALYHLDQMLGRHGMGSQVRVCVNGCRCELQVGFSHDQGLGEDGKDKSVRNAIVVMTAGDCQHPQFMESQVMMCQPWAR